MNVTQEISTDLWRAISKAYEGGHYSNAILDASQLKSADNFYSYLAVKAGERAFLEKYASFRYAEASIPKRRGGTRTLLVPERRLKFLQRQTLKLLEQLHSSRAPVHGFVKGKGAITNANEHQKRPYLLNLDLEDFFGTISRRRVVGLLEALGLDTEVAKAIAVICVTRNQLPQGAPTSPILANMISYRLDGALMSVAKKHHLRYTRYADDISFSSYAQPLALFEGGLPVSGRVPVDRLSNSLRAAIQANGLSSCPAAVMRWNPSCRKSGSSTSPISASSEHLSRYVASCSRRSTSAGVKGRCGFGAVTVLLAIWRRWHFLSAP